MGLRPWNIFRKTLYAAHKDITLSKTPLPTQLSFARARLQAKESTAVVPVSQNLSKLVPASATVWLLLLAAQWHYNNKERLQAIENQPGGAMLIDFLAWRVTAHLGPYQIPNIVRARLYEEPLRLLQEPLLLDHERARALNRLEQITQRHVAASAIAPQGEESKPGSGAALRAIEPLLLDAFMPQLDLASGAPLISQSHQVATARIILDVVAATPPEDRSVPKWVLHGIVTTRSAPWGVSPQGEELRAVLLVQLLRAQSNCTVAASMPEVVSYLQQPGMKSKEDTLWPIKAYLLSGETPDLIRRGARFVNQQHPGAVDVQAIRARDTPSLEVKKDLRNFWTTMLLTTGWSAYCAWRGVFNQQAALDIARHCGITLGAMGVLEVLWHTEERIIQSSWYYEDFRASLACSAGMCFLNCMSWAWAFRYSTLVPFIVCRLMKDDFMDAFKSFDP